MKKLKVDRSSIIIYALYVVVFVGVIVISIFNVGMDPNKIFTTEFLGNLCLNYALTIILSIASMRDSENKEMNKKYFTDARDNLLKILKKIKDRSLDTVFKCYCKFSYIKQRNEYIEGVLFKNGISKELYNYDVTTLNELYTAKKITKDQLDIILRFKRGKFKFREISAEEIMSDYDRPISYQDMRGHRKGILISKYGPKLVTMFAISALFASTSISQSDTVGGIAWSIIMRLITIVLAIFFGYTVGIALIQDKVAQKQQKELFCSEFLVSFDSGQYVPSKEEINEAALHIIKELSNKNDAQESDKKEITVPSPDQEEIELTEEELQSIIKKRKASAE